MKKEKEYNIEKKASDFFVEVQEPANENVILLNSLKATYIDKDAAETLEKVINNNYKITTNLQRLKENFLKNIENF